MKAEFVAKMNYQQMVTAYECYTKLQALYEEVCGGPYKAMEYREYFALRDGREALRQKCLAMSQNR